MKVLDMNPVVYQKTPVTRHNWPKKPTTWLELPVETDNVNIMALVLKIRSQEDG